MIECREKRLDHEEVIAEVLTVVTLVTLIYCFFIVHVHDVMSFARLAVNLFTYLLID